ncbi:MAG: ABC transporter permease [Gemmatimonadota bacterium]|nr:ABC transporter permease [Gemmatimonadota bacterium]
MLPTWVELRVALRTLKRSKAFATFAVLALALAIAANTTMSSLIDGLIWPEMAFPDPGQLVVAHWTAPKSPLYPNVDIRQVLGDSGRTYSGVSTWSGDISSTGTISVGSRTEQVPVQFVGGNFFRVLGSRPIHGTLYTDPSAAAQHVAVISDRLWRLLGPPDRPFAPFSLTLAGNRVIDGGNSLTIIGVVANNGAIPLHTDLFIPTGWGIRAEALIRIRHGVSWDEALKELNAVAPNLDPSHSRFAHFTLRPASATPGQRLGVVWALAAATLAVLVIACANIANLLLARGLARGRELATRLAFGASRLQVARLLFAESGLIAIAGGVSGVFLSLWTIHLVSATLPAGLQRMGLVQPQLSWRVLAAGIGLTVASALVFGVAPMVALMRADINGLLKGAANRHTTGGRGRFQFLVVAEVAGALTLVVSASLLGAVAGKLHLMDLGYDRTNLLVASAADAKLARVDQFGIPPGSAVIRQREGELRRLRAMPGVAAVTATWSADLYPLVRADDPGGGAPMRFVSGSRVEVVDPGFLRVMRISIVRGRDFYEHEDDPIPSVIIDQGTAHWLFAGADPLGRLVKFENNGKRPVPWMRIVGIAATVMMGQCGIDPCSTGMFFIANGAGFPAPLGTTNYVVRSRGPAGAFVAPLRQAVASDYPGAAPEVSTWDDATGASYTRALYDFVGTLFGAFALIGLLLALIGVYGVTAYAVEQRQREFGVRIALGAQTRDIVTMVLRQGNATALLGLALGLIVANWTEHLLAYFLWGYDQMALYFMGGAVLALFAATVVAGIPPALRAARTNPVDTLRSE